MEIILFLSIGLTLLVSCLCSISEAALYSVPLGYVKHLAESGSRIGRILLGFKEDIGKPIAAVLILNTIANSTGPAIGGALVVEIWGDHAVVIFAFLMTVGVLFFSEIIPKVIGVTYSRQVAVAMALPLRVVVAVLRPILWITGGISEAIQPEEDLPSVSHEEVLSMAAIGTEEGALDHFEGSVITNVIGLDKLPVGDVLTPRVVVFRLNEETTLSEIEEDLPNWSYTRVPLYAENDPDHLKSYVIQRDIYRELLRGNKDLKLKDLARNLQTVPELMRVDKLLFIMFEKKEHICAVVDEHGGLAGLITLEDIMEEIVGREIVDEYDTVSDLRKFAGMLRMAKSRKKTN